jgi:hypothetical protein
MVLLQRNTADEKPVADRLGQYGLSVTERSTPKAIGDLSAPTFPVVTVPTPFEKQWVQVLCKEPAAGRWSIELSGQPGT